MSRGSIAFSAVVELVANILFITDAPSGTTWSAWHRSFIRERDGYMETTREGNACVKCVRQFSTTRKWDENGARLFRRSNRARRSLGIFVNYETSRFEKKCRFNTQYDIQYGNRTRKNILNWEDIVLVRILYTCTIPQTSTLRLRLAEDGKPAWTFGVVARAQLRWLPEIHYGGRRRICWNIACIRDVNDVNKWDAHRNDTRIHLHRITVEG